MKASWPHCITAVYAVFATAMIGFAVYASTHHGEQLVSPDYYDQEVNYQQRMEQERRSRDLVVFETSPDELLLRFRDARAAGTLQLYRPSNAALDQTIPLALNEAGWQTVRTTELERGLWKARVQWLLGGQVFFNESSFVLK